MSSPLTGYFLLLQTTGHKSHKPRFTPLNYAIEGGCIICLAGFGEQADWLANVRTNPNVIARLPDCLVEGRATEVKDQEEARRLAVRVARNCGFALVFEHPRCLFMTDKQLAEQIGNRPVVRIQPFGELVAPGSYDPGGRGWILPMLIQCLALLGVLALIGRRRQHASMSER